MFLIKRVADARLADRIKGSFGIEDGKAVVYGAFKGDDVLGTAVFLEEGKCLVFHGVDTGRRMDVDLADGMARAAFSAGMRTGVTQGRLADELSSDLKIALTKRGYDMEEAFSLAEFFSKRNCRR